MGVLCVTLTKMLVHLHSVVTIYGHNERERECPDYLVTMVMVPMASMAGNQLNLDPVR